MKIRTRLLLVLLPTLALSIAFVSALLAYNWHKEIAQGSEARLKSALVVASALVQPADLEKGILSPELQKICSELHITRLYLNEKPSKGSLHAQLPLSNGSILAAEISLDSLDQKFQESLFLVIASAALAIALTVAVLLYLANKISRPVQSLNNSALAIAAGQYGESAALTGPKEVAELANTLNTMSECLLENINRLKENSLLRERMYGEYECAMLLQHLMLQKNIDDCRSDAVAVKSLTLFSDSPRGLLLELPKTNRPDLFQIHMAEAEETGLEGMYQLLTQFKHSKELQTHTSILFDRAASTLQAHGPHFPIVWSLDQQRFLEPTNHPLQIESGDLFFLFNQGFSAFFKEPKLIHDLLAKVLKVFAPDGLETTAAMLQKELAFATKRKELSEDIHLLCFQILS
jgi:HAMP domain-containing protein